MSISDNYIVQYLLQATQSGRELIVWKEKESEGYTARVRGIQLDLENVTSRTGSRLYLSFTCLSEKVQIREPLSIGVIRTKYESDDQQALAGLMKELAVTVARQCAARRNRSAAAIDGIRQTVYRRLIDSSE